jgi:tetratricopeptide (TPR) repeat protein
MLLAKGSMSVRIMSGGVLAQAQPPNGRHSITRAGIVALGLFCVSGSVASAGSEASPASYWASVSQYARGDRQAATEAVGSVSERDIAEAVRTAQALANAGRRCVACEARERFDALPIRAAILLHAEVERTDRARATASASGPPDCVKGRHATAVDKLLKSVVHQTGGTAFLIEFHTIQALYQRSVLCFVEARRWADAGLKLGPKEPLLHLTAGLAEESLVAFSGVSATAASDHDVLIRNAQNAGGIDRDDLVSRAAERYSKALTLNPVLVEAHLRLGRLRHRQGKADEARKSLRQAISLGSGPLLYLAHLFLGQSFESEGDLEAAVQEYRRALVPEPGMQTASVALANALVRQGRPAEGREILDRALSESADRRLDAYWSYLVGDPVIGEALFARLLQGLPR